MGEPEPAESEVPPKRARRDLNCEQCTKELSKYTCPKCGIRTCSVACVKGHKDEKNCDGTPQKWAAVEKISQYEPSMSIKDQQFLSEVGGKVPQKEKALVEVSAPELLRPPPQMHSRHVSQLLQNCTLRRIWLTVDDENELQGSRHECYSDTIFWSITLTFKKTKDWEPKQFLTAAAAEVAPPTVPTSSSDVEDGELSEEVEETDEKAEEGAEPGAKMDEDEGIVEDTVPAQVNVDGELSSWSYTATNIPESLRFCTLVKQFLRPKEFGTVVSKSDLDLDALEPFLKAPNSYLLYLQVECGATERFYPLDPEKSIVDNLRNKFLCGHPEVLVVLDQDPHLFPPPAEAELEQLRADRRLQFPGEGVVHDRRPPFRGGGRGGFGRGRGGFGRDRGGFAPRRGGPFRGGPRQGPPRGHKRPHHNQDDSLDRIFSSNNLSERDIAALR